MGARKTGNLFLRGSGKVSNLGATLSTNIPHNQGKIEILILTRALRPIMRWKIFRAVMTLNALKEFKKFFQYLKLILVVEQFVAKGADSLLQKSWGQGKIQPVLLVRFNVLHKPIQIIRFVTHWKILTNALSTKLGSSKTIKSCLLKANTSK